MQPATLDAAGAAGGERSFSINMLSQLLEVGPLPATATVKQLREHIQKQTGKAKVKLAAVSGSSQLLDDTLLRDVPEDLVAVAVLPPIVLHNGSYRIEAGFAGLEEPQLVLPAPPRTSKLTQDWEAMEKIWRQAFVGLGVSGFTGCLALITEPICNPYGNRRKTAELMFETLGVEGLCLMDASVLALGVANLTTGVVLDIGMDGHVAVPIVHGFLVEHAIQFGDGIGGEAVTRDLADVVGRIRPDLSLDQIRRMKEQACFVLDTSVDGTARPCAQRTAADDDLAALLGDHRFTVPELLFDDGCPEEHQSVQRSVFKAALGSGALWNLCENVVLTGGTTLLPGFAERLRKELTKLLPASAEKEVKVSRPGISPWCGGSEVAASDGFTAKCITRSQYDKEGLYAS